MKITPVLPKITRYFAVLLLGILGGIAISRITLNGITVGAHAELGLFETWARTKSRLKETRVYREIRSFRKLVREKTTEQPARASQIIPAPENQDNIQPEVSSNLSFTEDDAASMMELLKAER